MAETLAHVEWGVWITLLIRAVAFLLYADHFRRVLSQYESERTPRLFRSLVIAGVVVIGTFAIMLGGVRLLFPEIDWMARMFGAVAAGAVLVGAIFVFISHRWQGDAR